MSVVFVPVHSFAVELLAVWQLPLLYLQGFGGVSGCGIHVHVS